MTLHFYFARKFFWRFLAVLMALFTITALSESIEIQRMFRANDMPYTQALQLSLLKTPASIYRLLPIIVTLATLSLFLNLSRTSELVITRAAGRSAMRSLIAPCAIAFLIGLVGVGVLSPILSATTKLYDTTVSQLRSGGTSSFSLTRQGLWLRQGSAVNQTVIFAERANFDGTRLFGVTIFEYDAQGLALRRLETASARLVPGAWALGAGKSWDLGGEENVPEKTARVFTAFSVASELTADQILDSLGDPENVSFWDLQKFAQRLDNSGFSSLKHRIYFQVELAQPFFLLTMVLIAAAFTMRPARFGRTGILVLIAVLTGFSIFFLRNFAQILGANGEIPIKLAAWGPPSVAVCLALGLLLHFEDG